MACRRVRPSLPFSPGPRVFPLELPEFFLRSKVSYREPRGCSFSAPPKFSEFELCFFFTHYKREDRHAHLERSTLLFFFFRSIFLDPKVSLIHLCFAELIRSSVKMRSSPLRASGDHRRKFFLCDAKSSTHLLENLLSMHFPFYMTRSTALQDPR